MHSPKAKFKYLILIGLLFPATQLVGQDSAKEKTNTEEVASQSNNEEGGWKYLGERLTYKVKKRMNLTTAAEDKDAKAKAGKKLRLKILGIEVMTPGKD